MSSNYNYRGWLVRVYFFDMLKTLLVFVDIWLIRVFVDILLMLHEILLATSYADPGNPKNPS